MLTYEERQRLDRRDWRKARQGDTEPVITVDYSEGWPIACRRTPYTIERAMADASAGPLYLLRVTA